MTQPQHPKLPRLWEQHYKALKAVSTAPDRRTRKFWECEAAWLAHQIETLTPTQQGEAK